MATFAFYCEVCEIEYDIMIVSDRHGDFHPGYIKACPICAFTLKRDYKRENKAVHYKGTGFYETDKDKKRE